MFRLIIGAVSFLALSDTVHAHFVWLERDGDGPARAYFGEWIDDIREKTGGLLDRFKFRGCFLARAPSRCRSSGTTTIWNSTSKAAAMFVSWTAAFRHARTRKKAA